ncbi:MAG: hypothetical protein ND895_18095 [Pyrinomonadaceae bacterium]|nr:hypothetical protein [Pyrinomonadaceae bacterium]
MNCQIFETVVNDLAREQMMEANAREEAIAHSGVCEACALRLSLERRLTSGLRALAAEMMSASAPARVEQQLLAAFRNQGSLLPQIRPANRSRYWLVAAAAVVLIAVGIGGMKLGLDGPAQTAIKTEAKTDGQNSQVSTGAIEHLRPEPTPEVTPAVHRPKRKRSVQRPREFSAVGNEAFIAKGTRTSDVEADESEVTTQFLPFSYVSPASLQDGGQLVRVELPRSAMVRFGLPVNMERYGEKVKADVLVSADGLARAIRFVQ